MAGRTPGRAMILPSNVPPPYTDCELATSRPGMAGGDAAIAGQGARETAARTLRSIGDTPCDLDISDTKALRVEHWRCVDNPDRKVLPMLPEPTVPKRAAASARPQPWAMTPLFSVPDSGDPDEIPSPGRGSRGTRAPGRARRTNSRPPANSRIPANRTNRNGTAGKSSSHKDAGDLLVVTAERLRRALGRSFLRYGVAGDLEAAVHAAMNVIEPVLEARDTEILRLRGLMAGKLPRR